MVLSHLTDEEKIIIGLTFLLSCFTIPLMHSRMKRLKSLHPTVQKKVKTITILQIVCFVLVVFKILTIRLINCGIFGNVNYVNKNLIYFLEFVNLVCMVGLIVCISIMNGIWWEFYYTSFDYFGRTYIAILLFSIICLAWIPLTLKNTFFPEELMQCVKRLNFRNSFIEMQDYPPDVSKVKSKKLYPPDTGIVYNIKYEFPPPKKEGTTTPEQPSPTSTTRKTI